MVKKDMSNSKTEVTVEVTEGAAYRGFKWGLSKLPRHRLFTCSLAAFGNPDKTWTHLRKFVGYKLNKE